MVVPTFKQVIAAVEHLKTTMKMIDGHTRIFRRMYYIERERVINHFKYKLFKRGVDEVNGRFVLIYYCNIIVFNALFL